MLLQTNSYIVPRDKRMEHARLLRRFRQTLMRLGCDHFEVYEQVGANWNTGETTGRFVQIMRFRDRKHQLSVQGAERTDPVAQALVREFCELINFSYQQQQGLFAVGFYTSFLRMPPQRTTSASSVENENEPEVEADVETIIDPNAPTSAEPGIVSITGGGVVGNPGGQEDLSPAQPPTMVEQPEMIARYRPWSFAASRISTMKISSSMRPTPRPPRIPLRRDRPIPIAAPPTDSPGPDHPIRDIPTTGINRRFNCRFCRYLPLRRLKQI